MCIVDLTKKTSLQMKHFVKSSLRQLDGGKQTNDDTQKN